MILFSICYKFLQKFYHIYRLFKTQIAWRNRNPHNYTVAENVFDFGNIVVGKHTYGPLTVFRWGSKEEGLKIGNYCSIASGVKFILGGNHDVDLLLTYPVRHFFGGGALVATSKGVIVIEDDVWIGTDATILSGVKVGRGAVIAAGSIVTKDVGPYEIVGGVPAKVLKKRFSDSIIKSINQYDYESASFEESVTGNAEILSIPLDDEIVQELNNHFTVV